MNALVTIKIQRFEGTGIMAYWHDHSEITEEDCYLFSFSSEMHSLGRGGTDVAMVFKSSPR